MSKPKAVQATVQPAKPPIPDVLPDLVPRISIEQMIQELLANGWHRWKGHMFVWVSPDGLLFRGPAKAYDIMRSMQ